MDFLNTGYTWIPFMVQLAQWGIPLKVRDMDDKVLPTAVYFLSHVSGATYPGCSEKEKEIIG